MDEGTTYIAETDFRGKKTRFGIKNGDRSRHFYVIGKSGVGKSNLLENMAIQDIQNGHGLAFIDPHGSAAEKLLEYVPEHRIKDVVYFSPFDLDYPISFNVMEDVGKDSRHLVVNGLMSAFKKIWGEESWSDRMAYILTNTLLALLEYPGSTLLGVNRMIADKEYRNKVVANVTDPSVKSYWLDEFANYTERFAAEATPAIQNKIGQFTSNPLIRNIIGQPKSSFDFRRIMDEKKILIVNLAKGRLGEGNANLIGSMLITKLYLAAMSRANVSADELRRLPPFYLFVDEFQSFANESFANILSEARKYKLSLTLANQYVDQMSEEVRAAVFGNVGTTVVFRVGPLDAELLERLFAPTFTKEDLVNLGRFQIYLSLMINDMGSAPFSATTLPPIATPAQSYREQIIAASRQAYAQPRDKVEQAITAWHDAARAVGHKAPPAAGRGRSAPPAAPKVQPPLKPPFPTAAVPAPVIPQAVPPVKSPAGDRGAAPVPPSPLDKVAAARPGISLRALAPVPDRNKSTGKHAADLKAILQSVQKAAKPAPVKLSPPSSPSAKPSLAVEPKKEVPEAELKKMLEV